MYIKGSDFMLAYDKLFLLLKERDITTYQLRNKYVEFNISSSTIRRLHTGQSISSNTIDSLCHILKCKVEDIIEFKEN